MYIGLFFLNALLRVSLKQNSIEEFTHFLRMKEPLQKRDRLDFFASRVLYCLIHFWGQHEAKSERCHPY